MALYSFAMTPVSRSVGRSAVAAAAYRSGEKLVDERRGEVMDFTRKRGVLHAEILLPEGAPAWAGDRGQLWNEVERREDKSTRPDQAKTAREFRLALPHELSSEERLKLTRQFSQSLVDRYGAAVDFAIHQPSADGDERNFHAHIMMTTRPLGPNGFGSKIRKLDDRKTGPRLLTEMRQLWAGQGADCLQEAGYVLEAARFREAYKTLDEQRVAAMRRGDHILAAALDREPTIHVGPSATAMERNGEVTELGDLNRDILARNAERHGAQKERAHAGAQIIDLDAERARREEARTVRAEAQTFDPDRILASLTERRATFTRADLNYHLKEFLPDAKARIAFMDHALSRPDVVALREDDAAPVSRYTTQAVLDHEKTISDTARRMAGKHRHGVSAAGLGGTLEHHSHLDSEQRAALNWATRPGGLAIIAGEAGTGKSTTLAAIRDAYAAEGFKVQGLSWTNAVVHDMKPAGYEFASTIAAELMRQKAGKGAWTARTVLMVDETAMICSKHLGALLAAADQAGAKVILAGDAQQLSSIERGGMFGELQRQHGAAELHHVRRVADADQRLAFNAMHRGDFRAALEIFNEKRALHWSKTPDDSRAALVAQWARDSATDNGKKRFVFAYTNAEVHDLNKDLRAIRRERGELGPDHVLQTREGPQSFAMHDRVQFTANAASAARRDAGLFNGAAGVIQQIEDNSVSVALDVPKDAAPRVVSFKVGPDAKAGEFDALRHGYAGTIYKGQGKTLDQTYLLHSDHWRSAASYVALSRHRDTVKLFAAEAASPWVMAEGGLSQLTEKQRASAERSYAAWRDAKPSLAARYGLADYVGYVQRHWQDEARLNPLDRLARQMGRVEETRAASSFVQGHRPDPAKDEAGRKPHLSIIAGVVADYLKLCYDPARDWLKWVAEDLRHRASSRRGVAPLQQGMAAAHSRDRQGVADLRPVRGKGAASTKDAAADYVSRMAARAEAEILKQKAAAPERGKDQAPGRLRPRGRDR